MLGWILNPYGIELGAYVGLWVALLLIALVSIVGGVVRAIRGARRDR